MISRILAVSLALVAVQYAAQGTAADRATNEDVETKPLITVKLQLSQQQFSPKLPNGKLICVIQNDSTDEIEVPTNWVYDDVRVFAVGTNNLVSPNVEAVRRSGLNRYSPGRMMLWGQRKDAPPASRTLKPGESYTLFDFDLKELLKDRESPTFVSKAASDAKSTDEDRFQWDWRKASRPPASPIHSRDGYMKAAEFRVEVQISDEIVRSNSVELKVSDHTTQPAS